MLNGCYYTKCDEDDIYCFHILVVLTKVLLHLSEEEGQAKGANQTNNWYAMSDSPGADSFFLQTHFCWTILMGQQQQQHKTRVLMLTN